MRPATDPRRQEFETWRGGAPANATLNVGLQRIGAGERTHPRFGNAPDEALYRSAFRAFVAAYGADKPRLRIGPWNEPNFHPPDGSRVRLPDGVNWLDDPEGGCGSANPTVANCGPRLAAYYYRWAAVDCPDCNLAAGEFAGTQGHTYLQRYKHHLAHHRPDIWGVHNYADIVRFQVNNDHRSLELKTFLRELFCTTSSNPELGHHCGPSTNWASGELWIGATGANYSLACAGHPGLNCAPGEQYRVLGEDSQCNAAAFLMRLHNVTARLTRIYVYTFMDGSNPAESDDTGIVSKAGTVPRKAYHVVARRLESCAGIPAAAAPSPPPAPAPAPPAPAPAPGGTPAPGAPAAGPLAEVQPVATRRRSARRRGLLLRVTLHSPAVVKITVRRGGRRTGTIRRDLGAGTRTVRVRRLRGRTLRRGRYRVTVSVPGSAPRTVTARMR